MYHALTMCKGNALVLPFILGRVLKIYNVSRMRKSRLFGDEPKTLTIFSHIYITFTFYVLTDTGMKWVY